MDRERLRRWLTTDHRTWRWRHPTDPHAYEAVEAGPTGLEWYRWSHRGAGGGKHDVQPQSYAELEADGPPRDIPEPILAELRSWIASRTRG
ncbi:MAG: hypothetical protein ACOC9O_02040 [Myxococcota bacterium]